MTFNYQVGGSLPADAPSYVERQCDRDYYELLKERKYCYVFNCRQMGKSSLRVRVTHKLQAEGIVCATIDPQKIGVEVTCEQWYASAIRSLVGDLDLKSKFDLRSWIRERELLSPVQRFAEFIETVVLQEIDAPIVIFVEEIDRLLSLKFGMDDFFGLVRSFFEDRPTKPEYNRLTFSFLGVATPTDLIQSHNTSAFNIGYAVEMAGFTLTEALPLMQGLATKVANPQDYLAEAVKWTGGQPFLIQRLLGMMEKELAGIAPPKNIAGWVENLVQERIVTNWESQDAPPHLTTIRDRVLSVEEKLRGRMLGCYQQVLADGALEDDRSEERSKLRLTGLVVRRDGRLVSYNPIYGAVFNNAWVEGQLADLRPEFYASAFRAWRDAEEGQNQGFLLRGQALEEAEVWARGKRLSDADEHFLRESRNVERQEINIKLESERQAREIAERSNQILEKAEKIAKQKVKISSIFLILTLTASGIATIWSGKIVGDAKLVVADANLISKLANIRLLGTASKTDFLENREIESLLEVIKVAKKLKQIDKVDWIKDDLQNEVLNILTQIVYGIKERNRWNSIKEISLSPDNKIFASVNNDGIIQIWTLDGRLTTSFPAGSNIDKLSWSPDGKILASIDSSSTKLWSIDGNLLKTLPSSYIWSSSSRNIAWSPNSKNIVLIDKDRPVAFSLWSIDGKLLQTFYGHNNLVLSISWSPDGEVIASGSKDGTVKLWNIDGELLKTLPSPSPDNNGRFGSTTGSIWCLEWSPDSKILAAGGNDRTIQLWNRDGEIIANLRGHSDAISSLSWSYSKDHNSHLVLSSSSRDGTIKLWSYLFTRSYWNFFTGFEPSGRNGVASVYLIPESKSLISLSFDGILRLWDSNRVLLNQINVEKVMGHDIIAIFTDNDREEINSRSGVISIAFSPNGKTIATSSTDGTAKLWSLDGREIQTFNGHLASVAGVVFSPDGKTIATSSRDKTAKLWSLDGREIQTFKGHLASVVSVIFSPDGKTIATSSGDKTAKLWSLDGREIQTFKGHNNDVTSVVFSPNGKTIATSSGDKTAKLWSLDGREIQTFKGHSSRVLKVIFSSDGKMLATGGWNKTVKLWNLDFDDLMAKGCAWLHDYLVNNPNASDEDRQMCGIAPRQK